MFSSRSSWQRELICPPWKRTCILPSIPSSTGTTRTGDFISKRRYKEGVYAIPYEGEEVKLYWANQDQYYIKTSENFKDYTFVFDGITVHFRLVDATTEQNNNKESKDSKRTFMLFTEDEENYPGIKTFEYDAEAREIVIRFVYDIPEDKKRQVRRGKLRRYSEMDSVAA